MQLFAHYVDAYHMTSPNGVLIFIVFFVFVAFFLNVIVYAIGCFFELTCYLFYIYVVVSIFCYLLYVFLISHGCMTRTYLAQISCQWVFSFLHCDAYK